jgi:hypothetical protein
MEIPIYLCLIFIFSWLIYNHFQQIEGLECKIDSTFRKKSPDQVKILSYDEKSIYECQLSKYNAKSDDVTNLKLALRSTKKMLPEITKPLTKIKTTFKSLKKTYEKWKITKAERDDSIDQLNKFVNNEKKKSDNDTGHCAYNPESCEEVDSCELDETLCKGQDEFVENNGDGDDPMRTSFKDF